MPGTVPYLNKVVTLSAVPRLVKVPLRVTELPETLTLALGEPNTGAGAVDTWLK